MGRGKTGCQIGGDSVRRILRSKEIHGLGSRIRRILRLVPIAGRFLYPVCANETRRASSDLLAKFIGHSRVMARDDGHHVGRDEKSITR